MRIHPPSLAANNILLMRTLSYAFLLFSVTLALRLKKIVIQNKLGDRMMKQLLNSVIAKYWFVSFSLLATDKSRYFAQPRSIILLTSRSLHCGLINFDVWAWLKSSSFRLFLFETNCDKMFACIFVWCIGNWQDYRRVEKPSIWIQTSFTPSITGLLLCFRKWGIREV